MNLVFAPQPSEIVAAGFVALPDTSSLFSHPFAPGLLFKRVFSLAEAMACGGVSVSTPTITMGYVGSSMYMAYHNDLFGQATVVTEDITLQVGRRETSFGSFKAFDAAFCAQKYVSRDVVTGGFAMGIITRAHDGVFCLATAGTTVVSSQTTNGVGGLIFTSNYHNGGTFVYSPGGRSVPTAAIKGCSGFISFGMSVPSSQFFSSRMDGFLTAIPDDLKSRYSDAYVQTVASLPNSSKVGSQVKFFLGNDGWGTQSLFQSVSTRHEADYPQTITGVYKENAQNSPTSGTFTCIAPVNTVVDSSLLPIMEMSYTMGKFGTGANPLRSGSLVDVLLVQKATCKLDGGQVVPTSAVFPAMFLLSKPGTGTLVGEIDFSKQFADEMLHYEVTSLPTETTLTGTTNAETRSLVTAGEGKLKTTEEQRSKMRLSMGLDVRRVDIFLEKVNAAVRGNIGPEWSDDAATGPTPAAPVAAGDVSGAINVPNIGASTLSGSAALAYATAASKADSECFVNVMRGVVKPMFDTMVGTGVWRDLRDDGTLFAGTYRDYDYVLAHPQEGLPTTGHLTPPAAVAPNETALVLIGDYELINGVSGGNPGVGGWWGSTDGHPHKNVRILTFVKGVDMVSYTIFKAGSDVSKRVKFFNNVDCSAVKKGKQEALAALAAV